MVPKEQRSRRTRHKDRPVPRAKMRRTRLEARKTGSRCNTTGKAKWKTQIDALMALSNINSKKGSMSARNANSDHEVRVYQCPDCKHWHTTHKPEWKSTKGKNQGEVSDDTDRPDPPSNAGIQRVLAACRVRSEL